MPNDAVPEVTQVASPTPAAAPEVVQSAPESSAGPDGAAPAPDAAAQEPKPEAKPGRLFTQEELNRAARRSRKEAEERAYARARLEIENEQLRQQLGQPRGDAPNATQGSGEKPKPDQFKDWDSYQEALTDWKVDQKIKALSDGQRQHQEQRSSAEYALEVRSKMLDGADKYEDFEDVVLAPGVAITQPMVEAMADLEIEGVRPCDVAFYLGENPAESQRIAAIKSRAAQVREIDKIASKLVKPPEPTKAPDPIKPNAGTAAAVEKSAAEVAGDYKQWLKRRNRELGREVPR